MLTYSKNSNLTDQGVQYWNLTLTTYIPIVITHQYWPILRIATSLIKVCNTWYIFLMQSEITLWKVKFFVKGALELQAKNCASKADDNLKRKKEICDALAKTARKRNKKLSSLWCWVCKNKSSYYLPETLVTCALLKLLPRIKFLASRDDCESNHFVVVKLIQATKWRRVYLTVELRLFFFFSVWK